MKSRNFGTNSKIKIGNLWETPFLHILFTQEDAVVVARCRDFTVSSHGKDENEALTSLVDAIKEYIITAVENDAVDIIYDPAHSKYWRMYNELKTKIIGNQLKKSLKKMWKSISQEKMNQLTAKISCA
jgi:predicted RNase H-like HicB family nuclease